MLSTMSTVTSNGGTGASGVRSTSALERLRARRQNGGSNSDSSEKLTNGSNGKLNDELNDAPSNAPIGITHPASSRHDHE